MKDKNKNINRLDDLRKVGFWHSEKEADLPMPVADTDTLTDEQRTALLSFLRAGRILLRYMGCSWCRLAPHNGCTEGDWLDGSADMTDGVWLWPEALPHYIELHRVALPVEFVEYVMETYTLKKEV